MKKSILFLFIMLRESLGNLLFLREIILSWELIELIPLIADLPVESIAQLCNVTVEQATTLKQITTLGHTVIHVLNREFVGLRQIISCETMNPIYSTFVHQAFCDEAVAGMSWIFYTTLFIAIFSMFLIMFRAALYPIKDVALPASMRAEDRKDDVSIAASSTRMQRKTPVRLTASMSSHESSLYV